MEDDLIGMIDGKFKVIGFGGYSKRGDRLWNAECQQCGYIRKFYKYYLFNGRSKHCPKCGGERKSSRIDISGQKYGRLTAIKFLEMVNGRAKWLFKCDCGNYKEAMIHDARAKKGGVKSCGCLQKDKTLEFAKKHGLAHTHFWKAWRSMKARCNNKRTVGYHNYGGRGITYDSRWNDFENFKKDMYMLYLIAIKQYKIKHPSLERLDVDGNYCKENCTWIEPVEQNENRRNNKWFRAISPEGEIFISRNAAKFARDHGLNSPSSITGCLREEKVQYKNWHFEVIKNKYIIKKLNKKRSG